MARPKFYLPDEIKVTRSGRTVKVEIDGQELPYALARESLVVNIDPEDMPTVTLTLAANVVRVEDGI